MRKNKKNNNKQKTLSFLKGMLHNALILLLALAIVIISGELLYSAKADSLNYQHYYIESR